MNKPKEGAKGYCQNCGFAIHAAELQTENFHPKRYIGWVHSSGGSGGKIHCHYIARPKPHSKDARPTIPQVWGRMWAAERKLKEATK